MTGELPPKNLLLVEGADDQHVVRHLCGCHQDMPPFAICDKRGFPRLRAAIGPETKVSGRVALGILVDANSQPCGRWQAIAHQLQEVDIELPTQMAAAGAIVDGSPRVGVWLMPDNESTGELEDFVTRLIPDQDPIWPRAQRYIDDLPAAHRKFAAQKVLRAKIHAWLAVREEPRKMGAAIGAGDLDVAAPLAGRLVGWLRDLFG